MKKILNNSAMIILMAVTILCLGATSAQMINYQGRMTDNLGVPIDGNSVAVEFSIYDAASGGTALWTESQVIAVTKGLYSVKLGANNPIQSNLFDNADRWLGVKAGADPEMIPRSQITSVAYAFNSQRIGGKRIQSGQGTLNLSSQPAGTVDITFPSPFAAPPQVLTGALNSQIGAVTFIVDKVYNVTATGFTVSFTSIHGSTGTGSADFDWIAVGQ